MNPISTFPNTANITVAVGPASDVQYRCAATEAQIEVWLSSQQSVEANCAYNEISSLVFRGELNVQRLRQAIEAVTRRHDLLRSTLSADGQEVIVHANPSYSFDFQDFRGDPTKDSEEAQSSVIHQQATTPFDLVHGPLLRFVLQQLDDDRHKLTVAAHHLILDGWSLAVFCKDLGHFYDFFGGMPSEELPAADSYQDYAAKMEQYLASAEGKADEAFWLNQFQVEGTTDIPVLDLPIENNRPALRTYEGRRFDHLLVSDLIERVRLVGAKNGCSLFNTMLAAFNAYVARISGINDFCVGIPTAGQAAMDLPELVGHCVNTMPLRTTVQTGDSFANYMKACRKSLLDSFDHQRFGYGTLLRKLAPPRDPARPPMLAVSFNIDPKIDASKLGFHGLDVDVVIEPRSFENFEWFVNGVILEDKSIEMQVQYNSNLYSKQSIRFYLEGFETFLSELASAPDAAINDANVMSISQRKRAIVEWNDTSLEYPVGSTLHDEFSRQASTTPNEIAVTFDNRSLTYAEVESESNQIARYLNSQGVLAGDLVGICVPRSERMLAYLYGIMKSGAGYVPLDPAYPSDRLRYMCDHSGLKLVVTESELSEQVAEFEKPQIAIDAAAVEWKELDSDSVDVAAKPSDVCYVIYTSGSTGKPKGVQVPHGSVVNFLCSMQQTPGFGEGDSVLAVTTLSFDIAVLELYLPTISGGRVVILDSLTAADGTKLAQELVDQNITLMQATPATWRLMIEADWSGKPDLKILCGGEPMPQDLVKPLLDRCNELWNMYGPTETTVWSAVYRIESATAPILIGKPIGNTQIYLLDANGNEVPVGCEGELHIGGAGVTLGYLDRPDQTAERFVNNRYRNPFVDYVSDRLYKTGDLAKYQFDGNIQFLRRNDKQVKVRGFRIELSEIEQALKSHDAVQQNVVIVREDTPGDARLVAYVVARPETRPDAANLRDHLRSSLPYYMVPQHFVFLGAMPQTNNGKIDYKALPAPTAEVVDAQAASAVSPKTPAECYLADVWANILDTDDISLNDLFFDLGGHSLLVMKVITAVHDHTGVKLGPQDFLVATLEQLADKISESYVFKQQSPESPPAKSAETSTLVPNPELTPDVVASELIDDSKKIVGQQSEATGVFKKLTGFWN